MRILSDIEIIEAINETSEVCDGKLIEMSLGYTRDVHGVCRAQYKAALIEVGEWLNKLPAEFGKYHLVSQSEIHFLLKGELPE